MQSSIYIRPLELKDALVSYQWRNNPKIWRFTGSKPNQTITEEIETDWLKKALARTNEKRFAICLRENDRYIGNVFLTNITEADAELHIFIGVIEHWGNDNALQASRLILSFAFNILLLDSVYARINKLNSSSRALGARLGFVQVEEYADATLNMTITKIRQTKSEFTAV